MKIKIFLLVFFLLSCLEFFNPRFLPFIVEEGVAKAVIYVSFSLIVLYLILSNKRKFRKKNIFSLPFSIILIGMFISIFMASSHKYEQSFLISAMATLPYIVPYSAFFILKSFNIKIVIIEKIVLILGLINIILTFQLALLFPNYIFGSSLIEEESRGIRIAIVGDLFKFFLFFYSINQFVIYKSKKWIIVIIICIITIFMSLTRQVILISLTLALLFFLSKFSLIKKIITLLVFYSIGLYVLSLPYFDKLKELNERENDEGSFSKENIRVTAFKYFIDKGQDNIFTRIFGNGCYSYGNSEYGKWAMVEQWRTLCFPSDVSIASFYWFFGVLGWIGLIIIIFYAIKLKVPPNYIYIKYVLAYFFLASIASGPLLYYHQSIMLPIICYILGEVSKKTDIKLNKNGRNNYT